MTSKREDTQARALLLLAEFGTRLLPGTVRRIVAWKRLPSGAVDDLRAEVEQELALDCLEHASLVLALSETERNGRWMRLAERWIYRHHASRRSAAMPDDTPAPASACAAVMLPPGPDHVPLANGRPNLTATATRAGVRIGRLRARLEHWARRLGCDAEYDAFWRRRLAEALTGLAADLLRDDDRVHVLPRRRQSPDPDGRLRRIRRMAARFHVRPTTLRERSLLRSWLRGSRFGDDAPRRLLVAAVTLEPDAVASWLWLFEACAANGDLAAAAAALRRCRATASPVSLPVATSITLARARLLEVRGRPDAAAALLARASARRPRDHTLAAVAAQVAQSFSGR